MTRSVHTRMAALESSAAAATPPPAIAVIVDWPGTESMPAGHYADPNESTEDACQRLGIDPAHVTRVRVVDQSTPRPADPETP